MDFDRAAQRLQNEQSKLKGRSRHQPISLKAQKEAEYWKRQQMLLKEKRDQETAQINYAKKVMTSYELALGVVSLGRDSSIACELKATSIHGDGDKIALPPSILERLTANSDSQSGSPWTFRIGILNPNYTFPASIAMKTLKPPLDEDEMIDSDDEDETSSEKTEYLEELSQKYISYCFASVVEFTQEEGHIGLPAPIAAALLDPKRRALHQHKIPFARTQDPAGASIPEDAEMDDEKTPGHLAWGAFDVPSSPLEISLVTLPKGRACTLIPTLDAIQHGFHGLKDIKLVLEQSLSRTRATLSVGDTVATWHRGRKYNLTVSSVTPAHWRAVSCINTDIEVDIGPNKEFDDQNAAAAAAAAVVAQQQPLGTAQRPGTQTLADKRDSSPVPSTGQALGGQSLSETKRSTSSVIPTSWFQEELLPEPPQSQTERICLAQIRADKGTGRRRFDVHVATVKDLFVFASALTNETSFQLVTRFPRRVVTLNHVDDDKRPLSAVGIQSGQELFIVEKV